MLIYFHFGLSIHSQFSIFFQQNHHKKVKLENRFVNKKSTFKQLLMQETTTMGHQSYFRRLENFHFSKTF